VKRYRNKKKEETRFKMATAKDDGASIDVSKPKLEKFRGNDRDTLDIKTWCLQVSRLDTVQKLDDKNTAIIVMEALREQALSWALLLQKSRHPRPAGSCCSHFSWKDLTKSSMRRRSSSLSRRSNRGKMKTQRTYWTVAKRRGMGSSGN
jgi:hypothetical protein